MLETIILLGREILNVKFTLITLFNGKMAETGARTELQLPKICLKKQTDSVP